MTSNFCILYIDYPGGYRVGKWIRCIRSHLWEIPTPDSQPIENPKTYHGESSMILAGWVKTPNGWLCPSCGKNIRLKERDELNV